MPGILRAFHWERFIFLIVHRDHDGNRHMVQFHRHHVDDMALIKECIVWLGMAGITAMEMLRDGNLCETQRLSPSR